MTWGASLSRTGCGLETCDVTAATVNIVVRSGHSIVTLCNLLWSWIGTPDRHRRSQARSPSIAVLCISKPCFSLCPFSMSKPWTVLPLLRLCFGFVESRCHPRCKYSTTVEFLSRVVRRERLDTELCQPTAPEIIARRIAAA